MKAVIAAIGCMIIAIIMTYIFEGKKEFRSINPSTMIIERTINSCK